MALMNYYAELNPLSKKANILRQALAALLRADPQFEPEAFQDYVENTILPTVDDAEHRDHIKRSLAEFLNPRVVTLRRRKFDSNELLDRHF